MCIFLTMVPDELWRFNIYTLSDGITSTHLTLSYHRKTVFLSSPAHGINKK